MVIAVGQCGGRIMDGYFDPDGNFHGSDGGVLFGPGSSCKDYDAAALATTLGQWQTGNINTSIACPVDAAPLDGLAFCRAALPPGLSFPITPKFWTEQASLYAFACADGKCGGQQWVNVPCPGTGSDGDKYCRAFYQQFVAAPGASAISSCRPCRDLIPPNNNLIPCGGDYICAADCCPDPVGGFCVQRSDAAPDCNEYPCEP